MYSVLSELRILLPNLCSHNREGLTVLKEPPFSVALKLSVRMESKRGRRVSM